MKIRTLLLAISLLYSPSLYAGPVPPPLQVRPEPKPLFQKADVVVEWQEILEECPSTQLCIQGNLLNSGGKPATNVRIRVEIGNTSLAKPRVTKMIKLNESTLNPGDREEFSFILERKTPYKDHKGKPKIIEVGKYNFRIVPLWTGKSVKKQGR